VKRWLWLLIAICLPFPTLPQTTERYQDPEVSLAYARFFTEVWGLMERDQRSCSQNPDPTTRPVAHADNWLAKRLFSPSDTTRIKNAVSQWFTDRQVVWNALQGRPEDDPSFSVRVDRRYAGIAFDAGTKLGTQLEDPKHFYKMIRDCTHRLRFAPETDGSRCFAPPKPRFT